ncbi:porin [Pedobacter gandavensis]|uniref:porin n=1 Tax=Pedobacter gandavensis TaxID=2679963 RepID=UPI00292E9560|nr:porin [Pedobacter gandavensis]
MKIRTSIGVVLCAVCPMMASAQTPVDSLKQEKEKPEATKAVAKDASIFNLNVLGRTSLNIGQQSNRDLNASFRLDETRLLLSGHLNPDLSYKVRFRLNRSFGTTTQDNGSRALDYAQVNYRFGKQKDWEVILGKQAAAVGSYEFVNNPVYEYIFTDYVDRLLNLFVVGATFSHQINPNHNFQLQVYNTSTETLDQLIKTAGYGAAEFKQSNRPMGAYLTWQGSFLNKALQTKWSYNYNQLIAGADNHSVSLANMYQSKRTKVYLDLQYSDYGVDHTMLASNAIHAFRGNSGTDRTMRKDVVYKSAVLRFDHQFTNHWGMSVKGAYETASASKDKEVGQNFRRNWTGYAALEYKPVPTKDWKLFAGYIDNKISYKNRLGLPTEKNNRFILGTYFNLSAI